MEVHMDCPTKLKVQRYIKNKSTKIPKYKCTEKNIKSTKIQKIPGCQLWVQKSKGEQNIKRAKNSRKGTGAGYFTQKMYGDLQEKSNKKQGASVISLCELFIVVPLFLA